MNELQTLIHAAMTTTIDEAVGAGVIYGGDQYRLTKQIVTLAYALNVGTDGSEWESLFETAVQEIYPFATETVAADLVTFINDNYADFMASARAAFVTSIQADATVVIKADIVDELSA